MAEFTNCQIPMKKYDTDRYKNAKVLAVMNNKGGCGKSALVDALSNWLVSQGKNVLVIDNDPQANVTARFGFKPKAVYQHSMAYFYREENFMSDESLKWPMNIEYYRLEQRKVSGKSEKIKYYTSNMGRLGLLPGGKKSERYSGFTRDSIGKDAFRARFSYILDYYKHYFDFVIIDTAPAIENNASNELYITLSDEIIIPFDGNESITGLQVFMEWAKIQNGNSSKKPNVVFAMTKYQRDCICTSSPLEKSGIKLIDHGTTECISSAMYRIMKTYLGDYTCDHGVPERRKGRGKVYMGMVYDHDDIKGLYDRLCKDIFNKVNTYRDNLIDKWTENDIYGQIEAAMDVIESSRLGKYIPEYNTFQFRN